MVETCAAFGVAAGRRDGHPGCWSDAEGSLPRKIGALGIRVERGVSYHGIALNVAPDLADFDLIDPCGVPGLVSTSIAAELRRSGADETPATAAARGRPGRGPVRRATSPSSSTRRSPGSRPRPWPRRPDPMAAGLFELRKDPITGWWVATVVDRAFHRDRFAQAALPVDDRGDCQNCRLPGRARDPDADAQGLRVPRRRHRRGGPRDRRRRSPRSRCRRPGRAAAGGRSSPRPSEHRPLHAVGNEIIEGLVGEARDAIAKARAAGQTDHLQLVQNWGAQAGARTNHLCLDLYDLPQIPHRIAEELGGAARFVIREGECPWCRLVRDEPRRPERLVWQDDDTVAFAPFASRSPFEVWVVPRRHEADFGRAGDVDVRATARGAPPGARAARRRPRRAAVQPRPPHGAAARAGRRDVPLALGDPPPAARDRRPRAGDRPARSTPSRPRTRSRSCSGGSGPPVPEATEATG